MNGQDAAPAPQGPAHAEDSALVPAIPGFDPRFRAFVASSRGPDPRRRNSPPATTPLMTREVSHECIQQAADVHGAPGRGHQRFERDRAGRRLSTGTCNGAGRQRRSDCDGIARPARTRVRARQRVVRLRGRNDRRRFRPAAPARAERTSDARALRGRTGQSGRSPQATRGASRESTSAARRTSLRRACRPARRID